jgi:ATP-dependent protease ClpP protease subunit
VAKRKAAGQQSITWESVRLELNCTRTDQGQIDYDSVRRGKLAALAAHTKRPAVLYATDFLNESKIKHVQNAVAITAEDVRGLAEVVRGLAGDAVDLILHSPGGSPEAAESIVAVLRSRFRTVRVLVPVMAKSAATMIALAANEILMPMSAELGPIDPQFLLSDGRGGQRMTPAQAIIDEVERAQQAVAHQQADAAVWLLQVQRQPPGLYQQALNAVQLSKQLVKGWLEQYMLAGDPNATATAQAIVDFLGDHNRFLSHARRVDIPTLANMGAKIQNITDVDRQLWQLLEELWYTVEHTFQGSAVFKMWENSNGVALFQVLKAQLVPVPSPGPQP